VVDDFTRECLALVGRYIPARLAGRNASSMPSAVNPCLRALRGVAVFSVFAPLAGALERIAAVCFDLPERGHGASDSTAVPWEAGPFLAACATWLSWTLAPAAVVPAGIPEAGRWRVFFHNFRAILTESIPARFHQARSSPER